MSTHQPTALQVDIPGHRKPVRGSAFLAWGGAGLLALGVTAGLLWRAPAESLESPRAAGATSVATVLTLEPAAAGPTATTAPSVPSPTAPNGASPETISGQARYTPWSEPAAPAPRPRAVPKRQSAETTVAVAEPRPQVAPWRPIQPRQTTVDASETRDEAPRRVAQSPAAGDFPGEVAPAATAPAMETSPRELPRPVACQTCGIVRAVRAVQLAGDPSGLGAIAGGIVGGLLGSQVGSGSARKATTVLGAAGGGFAGHEIEKRLRGATLYDVQIRMDDGSTRTVRSQTSPAVRSRVRVEGDDLLPVRGEEPRFLRTGLVSR